MRPKRRRQRDDVGIDALLDREQTLQFNNERDREVLLGNFDTVLRDRRVRDLVWEILAMTGIAHVNAKNDASVFFTEGRRSVGQEILLLLDSIDGRIYPNMMLERASKEEDDE